MPKIVFSSNLIIVALLTLSPSLKIRPKDSLEFMLTPLLAVTWVKSGLSVPSPNYHYRARTDYFSKPYKIYLQ